MSIWGRSCLGERYAELACGTGGRGEARGGKVQVGGGLCEGGSGR